jgi:putative DNA-binding protein
VPTLGELQTMFGRALLTEDDQSAAAQVLGDGLPPESRLAIYRHHVLTTLTAVLRSTYPVVCRLVDERFFAYAADRYIRSQPPDGPCLTEYGASFPEFLAEFEPCRPLAYLPDVGRLEWALHSAIHAEEPAPLDAAALRALPADTLPQLRFRLDPSLTLLASAWPIDEIWRANQADADPARAVDLAAGGVWLEVRRIDEDAIVRRLDPATHCFRRALQDGRALEEAAVAVEHDAAFDVAGAVQALFNEGLLTDFTAPPPAGGDG